MYPTHYRLSKTRLWDIDCVRNVFIIIQLMYNMSHSTTESPITSFPVLGSTRTLELGYW